MAAITICTAAQLKTSRPLSPFSRKLKNEMKKTRRQQRHYLQSITRSLRRGPAGALSANVSGCVWLISSASITLKDEQLFPVCPWDKFNTINAILITIFSAIVCAVYHVLCTPPRKAMRRKFSSSSVVS